MTIEQYLSNPAGKGASVQLRPIQLQFSQEYEKIRDQIQYRIYSKGNKVWFFVLIPSHSAKGSNYEVLIEVDVKGVDTSPNSREKIDSLDFKCYSNSPSFVYTYAYVFHRHKMLIPFAEKLYDQKVLTVKPSVKNPYLTIGYERSLYMALRKIIDRGQSSMLYIRPNQIAIENDALFFANLLKSPDDKQAEIASRKKSIKQEMDAVDKKAGTPKKQESVKSQKQLPRRYKPPTTVASVAKVSEIKSQKAIKKTKHLRKVKKM